MEHWNALSNEYFSYDSGFEGIASFISLKVFVNEIKKENLQERKMKVLFGFEREDVFEMYKKNLYKRILSYGVNNLYKIKETSDEDFFYLYKLYGDEKLIPDDLKEVIEYL